MSQQRTKALTPEEIQKIRKYLSAGYTIKYTASKVGVSIGPVKRENKLIKIERRIKALNNIDKKEVCEFNRIGVSPETICKRFNITPSQFEKIISSGPKRKPRLTNKDYLNIIKGYKEGQLIKDIASKYNINRSWVWHILKKYL